MGCNFFDTADVYGHGHSETLLGEAPEEGIAAVNATMPDTVQILYNLARRHAEDTFLGRRVRELVETPCSRSKKTSTREHRCRQEGDHQIGRAHV